MKKKLCEIILMFFCSRVTDAGDRDEMADIMVTLVSLLTLSPRLRKYGLDESNTW